MVTKPMNIGGLILALFVLPGCQGDRLEGVYHADDGEGSRATMALEGGTVRFRQNGTSLPEVTGHYRQDSDRIIMSLGGKTLLLSLEGECLQPIDDPSQKICREK